MTDTGEDSFSSGRYEFSLFCFVPAPLFASVCSLFISFSPADALFTVILRQHSNLCNRSVAIEVILSVNVCELRAKERRIETDNLARIDYIFLFSFKPWTPQVQRGQPFFSSQINWPDEGMREKRDKEIALSGRPPFRELKTNIYKRDRRFRSTP